MLTWQVTYKNASSCTLSNGGVLSCDNIVSEYLPELKDGFFNFGHKQFFSADTVQSITLIEDDKKGN